MTSYHMNTLKPLRRDSLVGEVCEKLTHFIRGGEKSGDERWLPPERQLADRLGVSRTVMREATKRLESQGLVDIQHGVGIRVVNRLHKPLNGSLSFLIPEEGERLRQLMEARLLIEPEIAGKAAACADGRTLKELRRAQDELATAQTVADAARWDLEFHSALARGAGNKVLSLFVDSLVDLGAESRRRTIASAGAIRAHEHHARILAAVERRKRSSAAEAMRFHLLEAAKDLAGSLNGKTTASRE